MKTLGVVVASLFLFLAASTGSVNAQSSVVIATVRPNPLDVSISIPATVVVGQWFDISADVANLGDQTITGTTATINVPAELTVRGQKKRKIGDLAGGATSTVTWRAKANSSGNFVIQVEASGNLAGEQISSFDSTVISAVGSLAHLLLRIFPGV